MQFPNLFKACLVLSVERPAPAKESVMNENWSWPTIRRLGFWHWVLRECVRANPFYVISAALVSYGILSLTRTVNPQIGVAGGVLSALAILHIYELSLLGVAAIVLLRRRDGGKDLHGLLLVAVIFLAGSFIALDELVTIWPAWGLGLVLCALALAWCKITLYGRLPGLQLPAIYRYTALVVLAAHSASSAFGAMSLTHTLLPETAQRLTWLAGWVALIPVLVLLGTKFRIQGGGAPIAHQPSDSLKTPRAGACMIGVVVVMGLIHLVAADWTYDRSFNGAFAVPSALMIIAMAVIRSSAHQSHMSPWRLVLVLTPLAAMQWSWQSHSLWSEPFPLMLISPAAQIAFASTVFYGALAWLTGRSWYYLGLVTPVSGPGADGVAYLARNAPHFKAFCSVALGFLALLSGLLVSLYRDRMLRWMDKTHRDTDLGRGLDDMQAP